MGAHEESILHFKNITKTFPGVKALVNVDFSIRKGEIHALVGENGAGKSTLLNVLKGIYQPDSGEIVYKDETVHIRNPHMASMMGINMVHQELNMVPELTVAENVLLGNEPRKAGIIQHRERRKRCDQILESLGCDFRSDTYVRDLSVAQMQMAAVARTLAYHSSVVAFDEPTASLSKGETGKLFQTITKLSREGVSIIYVSHRLEEIFSLCDRVTVMRDGQYVGTYDVKDMDRQKLTSLMVGREVSEYMQHTENCSTDEVVLEVKDLCSKRFHHINFQLRKGEILGFSGLVGAGRTELVRAIFGADRFDSGEIYINGRKVKIKTPYAAIKNGIALLPEERKTQGFIGMMTNSFNINLSSIDKQMKYGMVHYKSQAENTEYYMNALKITPPNPTLHTSNLSGGNQQKIVLAKWLSVNTDIIIFDEPTRGLDVGAKAEIYKLMNDFVKEGKSIIMISSELPEILGMSDRVIVMKEGTITADIDSSDADEVTLLNYSM